MSTDLSLAIQITIIGMGLVFAAIVLLWLLMAVMVKITATRSEPSPEAQPEYALPKASIERKRRAAIAAVVAAIYRERPPEVHEFPLPPTATVSPWQAVLRAQHMSKRGRTR